MSHLSEDQLDELVAEERRRAQPPLNEWRVIAARAREEGLIRESGPRSWVASRPWIQAAAALLFLVGGVAIGRTTVSLPSANADGQDASVPGISASVTGTPASPVAST